MANLEGQAFVCLSSEKRADRFDQWVTAFRTADGMILVHVLSAGDDPGYRVGDRYRLDVVPVPLLD